MKNEKETMKGYVRLNQKQNDETVYGYIKSYDAVTGYYQVWILKIGKIFYLKKEELTDLPPREISKELLRKVIRAEVRVEAITAGVEPEGNLCFPEGAYAVTVEDFLSAMQHLHEQNRAGENLYSDWIHMMYELYDNYDAIQVGEEPEVPHTLFCPYQLEKEADFVNLLFTQLVWNQFPCSEEQVDQIAEERILEDIQAFQVGLAIFPYDWTWNSKCELVRQLNNGHRLHSLTEEEVPYCQQILEEMALEDDINALECLGYSYYGGNRLYSCDWQKSRDCFLQLMQLDQVDDQKKGQYANTLGYIYYYGRCNDGKPEYKKAFRYFSIGAAVGYYESIYKLSDLYLHGYGIPKNSLAAKNLIDFIYGENEEQFLCGKFDGKFADLALRRGNLCRDHIERGNPLYYYLIAEYAIQKRLPFGYYGDQRVLLNIQNALEECKPRGAEDFNQKRTLTAKKPYLLFQALQVVCKVTFREKKNGIRIKAKRMPLSGSEKTKQFFHVVPEYGFCEMTDTAVETARNVSSMWVKGGKTSFHADDLKIEGYKITFFLYGKEVAWIVATEYTRKIKPKSKSKKHTKKHMFAKVVFQDGGQGYDYLADDLELSVGDFVMVFAREEEKKVRVIEVFERSFEEMPLPRERYKKILRKL